MFSCFILNVSIWDRHYENFDPDFDTQQASAMIRIFAFEINHLYLADDPKLVARSAYVLIGEVALFTLTTDYITNVPSVHWRVNSLTTVQFSDSYTS